MTETAGYSRHPTLHGDVIVFVCEDDLWEVEADGGVARRLTAQPGSVSFPRLSPDGKSIAFTGRDDGPTEVYVMPAGGGPPRRLTWMGSNVRTVGWSRDGLAVLFQSNTAQAFRSAHHLHEVPARGGRTSRLPWGPAREVAWQPDGPGVVLALNSGDPARWKRYRGGTAGTLWVDRDGGGDFATLIRLEGNLAGPMWIGDRIYFLSDHEGHGNLYSCRPTGRGLRRHTHHEDFYVRFPSTDGRRIAYHAGADLHVHDVESDETQKVEVTLRSPRGERNQRFVSAARHLESVELHPKGHSLACVVRGGAFTFALWEGAPLRHGKVSSARYRLARWLPDGKRLVAITDDGGEEALVVMRADGAGRPRRVEGDFGRAVELAVAPAGRARIALTNHRQELWLVDLASGDARKVERSPHDRLLGLAWSPDGRWLAYAYPASLRSASLHLLDTADGKVHELTRPDFVDFAPAFDPEGKYLYFLSRRIFDPVYDSQYFDLGFPRGAIPCLVPLARDVPSPFDAATREPRRPRAVSPRGKEKGPVQVVIDLEGIQDRVVAFPVDEGRYERILGGRGRVFFTSLPVEGSLDTEWFSTAAPPAKAKLHVHDFERSKTEVAFDHVSDFALSMDASTLLLRVGNDLRVLPADIEKKELPKEKEPGRNTGWIDLERLRVAVVPGDEWKQMLTEAWRLQRDQFWTADMSGVNWKGVLKRYLPLVDRVGTRSEFSDLAWEMQGELGTSHCYEIGGDYQPEPRWFQGLLGADLEYDGRARSWRIARIPRGDSWNPKACSPLAAPGLGIAEGDLLLAVDGQAVGARRSPFERLVNQAEREVRLTVQTPGKSRRRVTVKTLGSETELRYRDWVEGNRERVHRETRGRVGYVHVPDMGPRGFGEFHRYYRNEVLRDGLVVDVRWNGGGHVSQLLLEKLLRKRIAWDLPRWQTPSTYPEDAPAGPMVALTNENAGSDGDVFCHSWKLYGLGPLIGKRTWGGVVGIYPRHALVDGTMTTQAEFSSWFTDVAWAVENYGTDPDIEVDIEPQDHAAGRDTQLDRGLAEIKRILEAHPPQRPKFDRKPKLRPPRLSR
ncbi:MAG: PDZ domain-containing protein [Planctomycetota bacterium]|nr:PDZ domain-containing protein [Planctomycetota bacterium]